MPILAVLLLGLALGQSSGPDDSYMQRAWYPAGKKDRPLLAQKASPDRSDLYLKLGMGNVGQLMVYVVNGTDTDLRLPTRSGSLYSFLEAKGPSGHWQPIEFHYYVDCGASYSEVNLPARHQWCFQPALQLGTFPTRIRVQLITSEGKVISNEIDYRIPMERFSVSPANLRRLDVKWELRLTNGFPVLRPLG